MLAEIEQHLDALRQRPYDGATLAALRSLLMKQSTADAELDRAIEERLKYHRTVGDWIAVVGLLDVKAMQTRDDKQRAKLMAVRGQLLHERLLDQEEALRAISEAVTLDEELTSRGWDRIEEKIKQRKEMWALIVDTHLRHAENAPNVKVAANSFLAAAEFTWRNDATSPRIEEYLRRCLQLDPENSRANFHLERFLRERTRFRELADFFQQRVLVANEVHDRTMAAVSLATLYAGELSDVKQAIELYRRALAIDAQNPIAFNALSHLLYQQEQWNELVQLLEGRLRTQLEGAEEISLLLRIGQLCVEKLNDPARGEEYYRRARKLDPAHPQMIAFYRTLYQTRHEPHKLVALLDAAQRVETNEARRVELLRELVQLGEAQGVGEAVLLAACREWLALRPNDEDAIASLSKRYESQGHWQELIDLCERRIAQCDDPEKREALWREMTRIASEQGHDAGFAIELWNRRLMESSSDAEALSALEALYRQSQRWFALAEIVERRIGIEDERGDRQERLRLLDDLAEIYTDRLRSLPNAIAVWRRVLAIEPHHKKAISLLPELLAQASRWDELTAFVLEQGSAPDLVETFVRHADLSTDDAIKIEVYRRAAEVCLTRLHDSERATKLYERALAVDEDNVDVARALVSLYSKAEKWAQWVEVYEIVLKATTDKQEQRAILRELSRISEERLNAKNLAFQWCAQAYALFPDDETIKEELGRLADRSDTWAHLVEILTRQLAQSRDELTTLRILRQLAEIKSEQLQLVEEAEQHLNQIVALDPSDKAARIALERIYESRARWADLAKAIHSRISLESDASEKLALWLRVAQLQEEQLANPHEAISCYRNALALDENNLTALNALERLERASGHADGLGDVLRRLTTLRTTAEARAEAWYQLGELRLERLDDISGALDAFEGALSEVPYHESTVKKLESLMISASGDQVRIAGLLKGYYQHAEAWPSLVTVLDVLIKDAIDVQVQVELLRQIFDVLVDKINLPKAALKRGAQLYALTPLDDTLRQRLVEISEETGQYELVIEAFEAALRTLEQNSDDSRTSSLKAVLHFDVATILSEQLDRTDGAATHLLEVVRIDPRHDRAATALERMLRELGRWTELREVFQRRLDVTTDSDEQLVLLQKLGALNDDVIDDAKASIEVYRKMWAMQPGNPEAARALARHYQQRGEWGNLIELLEQRVTLARTAEDRRMYHSRIAEIALHELHAPGRAIEAYRAILDENEHDRESALEVVRLLEQEQRWQELHPIYKTLLDDAYRGNLSERVDWMFKLAVLELDHLKDIDAALNRLKAILLEQLNHDAAIALLESLLGDEVYGQRVADILAPVYRSQENWSRLVHVFEIQERVAPLEERIALLRAMMRLYYDRLEEPHRAVRAIQQAIQCAAKTPHLMELVDEMRRLCGGIGEWRTFVETLEQVLPEVTQHDQADYLREAIADVSAGELRDVEKAKVQLECVLETNPGHLSSLSTLDRLYTIDEDWIALLRILELRLKHEKNPSVELGLQLRAGKLCVEKLHRIEQAIEHFEAVRRIDPANNEAIEALKSLYRESRVWTKYDRLLAYVIEHATGESRTQWLLERSSVQLQYLDEGALALETYATLLRESATREAALRAIENVLTDERYEDRAMAILEPHYEETEAWEKLSRLWSRRYERSKSDKERDDLANRCAKLYEEKLHDLRHAFTWMCRAFLLKPQSTVRERLATVAVQTQDWMTYADTLTQYVSKLAPDATTEKRTIQLELADIYEQSLFAWLMARDVLYEALPLDTDDGLVSQRLEMLLRKHEQWDALLELYRTQVAALTNVSRRRSVLAHLGELWETVKHDPENAISCYREIVSTETRYDAEAVVALERLYRRTGRWSELVALLRDQLALVSDVGETNRLRLRLAPILEERLGEIANAIDLYGAILQTEENRLAAVDALERLLIHAEYRTRITELLIPVYEANTEWSKLVIMLEAQLDGVQAFDEKIVLVKRIAAIYREQLGDANAAFRVLRRAFEEAPMESDVLSDLRSTAEQGVLWSEFVVCCGAQLERIANLEQKISLATEISQIDPERAFVFLERAFKAKPDEQEIGELLERNARALQRLPELANTLEQVISSEISDRIKVDYALKLAEWSLDEFHQIDRAERFCTSVLEIAKGNKTALSLLERIYRERGDVTRLADVICQRAMALHDVVEKIALLSDAATMLSDANRHDDALETWRMVLEWDDEHQGALSALASIYQERQDWPRYLEVLESQSRLTEEQERQIELKLRVAEVYEIQNEEARAIDVYREILELDSSQDRAFNALERLLTKTEAWHELYDAVSRQLERHEMQSSERRTSLRLRAAELLLDQLQDEEKAIEQYRALVTDEPQHPIAFMKLEGLLRSRQAWHDLDDIYRLKIEDARRRQDREAQLELLLTIARMWIHEGANPDAAADALEEILAIEPQHVSALAELARIYETTEQWERCGEVLQRMATLPLSTTESADCEYRMGFVRQRLGADDATVKLHFERALNANGAHLLAIQALETISRASAEWKRVAELLELRVGISVELQQQLELLKELGELYQQKLKQPQQAMRVWKRAAELVPDDEKIAFSCAEAAFQAMELAEAETMLKRLIERAGKRRQPKMANYYVLLGRIAQQRGDVATALTHFEQAYRMDSAHLETLIALGALYVAQENWQEARRIYRAMLLQNIDHRSGMSQAELFYHLGRVHHKLGETTKALSMFERGLEIEPEHQGLKEALMEVKK